MIDVSNIHNRIDTVGQEDRALQRCNPSAWSMPEDEREHIINNMLPSSCSSFGLKAINLLSWCAAPIIKVRYIKNSLPVGHMSVLYIRTLKIYLYQTIYNIKSYDLCGLATVGNVSILTLICF